MPSIMEDKTATLNGNLMVKPGGSLTLKSAKLIINCAQDGQYGISIERGGSILIDHSAITSDNQQYRFSFEVRGDRFEMRDSTLQGCGWGIPYAPYRLTENGLYLGNVKSVVVERNTFSNDFYGLILQGGASASIKNNTFSDIGESGIMLSGTSSNAIDGNSFSCKLFGVKGQGAKENTISNNTFSQSYVEAPIWLLGGSEHNIISKNVISIDPSGWAGIAIGTEGDHISNNNLIIDNTITGGEHGIAVYNSMNNRLENNTITDSHMGIALGCANGNDIINNRIIRNSPALKNVEQNAIELYRSSNNTIANNSISSALEHGILLLNSCKGNAIEGNSISACLRGIGLYNQSDNNRIGNNNITKSFDKSITLHISNNSMIYANNFIDNAGSPFDDGTNQWESEGKGNYWSNYQGRDSNGDGIGDSPQSITTNGIDHRPLMSPVPIAVLSIPKREDVPIPAFPPSASESDVISTEVVWQDTTVNYDKAHQITIADGGTLTLKSATLVLPWYFRGIMVQAGGKLNIIASKINPAGTAGGFWITVQKGASLVMRGSELDGCGFGPSSGDWGGLQILSTNISIENSIINNSVRGMVIDLSPQDVANSSPSIKN